jgi:3-oxoacyl-[acyl-carrier protein] reductase
MDLKLKNKVAIVTGGNHGLGKAICYALAAEGANIVINYFKDPQKADEMVREISEKFKTESVAIFGDMSNPLDVEDFFNKAVSKFKTLDILINNAAISPTSLVRDTDIETWNMTIKTNLSSVFLTSKHMANHLLSLGNKGKIINIVSTAAFSGSSSGRAHYDASKGGIISFTFSLARELGPFGVTVNAVAPGYMVTELSKERYLANEEKYLSGVPLKRFGEVGEIANVVTFLSSELAGYITGAVVNVSGGLQMR